MHLSEPTPQMKEEEVFPSLEQEEKALPLLSSLAATNLNYAWAFTLVENCVSLGVVQAVLCPGSRNTPLLLAFAKHPKIEALSALDERSAAFFALGLAKQSRRPVALVCTSGTAVANFYPAVIESYKAHVPLLVLTADRPSCSRYCSTRQTMNQLDVFGRFTRFSADLTLPEAKVGSFAYLRQTFLQAYAKALVPDPGPVHLNIPFGEPLDPKLDPRFQAFWKELQASRAFLPAVPPLISQPSLDELALSPIFEALLAAKKGLILLGSWQDEGERLNVFSQSLRTLSALLPWPILADVTSPARYLEAPLENTITTYDFLLADPHLATALKPSVVLQVGPLPNSQRLNTYLAHLDAPTYILHPYEDSLDPHHRQAQHLRLSLDSFVKALDCYCQSSTRPQSKTDPAFTNLWKYADALAQSALKTKLDAETALFDGKVAYELARIVPPKAQIVLANSRSVRNAEQFLFASDKGYKVYFNGGVNGSDGITSTALGIAHRNKLPTVLLTGDLAFFHDSNALLLKNVFQGQLTILLSNNAGGGIFHQLPVAQHTGIEEAFEKYIATPQQVCMRHMLEAYGLPYTQVQTWEDLDAIDFTCPGIELVEIKTNRTYDAAYHSSLFRTVSTQLRSLVEKR